MESFGFKSVDDLIIAVGYGKITPLQVVRKIQPKEEGQEDQPLAFAKGSSASTKKRAGSGVVVKGVDDILVRFGKCCQPVPGDPIRGFITRGFGVTVHRTNCVNILKTNPERLIEVEWDSAPYEAFPVKIRIKALDRVGLLADVAASISKSGANILSANSNTREDKIVEQ